MRRFIVLMIVAVMAAPVVSFAQGYPEKGGRGHGRMDYISELNLSKEQLAQVKDLQRDSRKTAVEIKGKIALKRIDFDEEMQKEKPDMKVLERLIDELTALHAQQYKAKLESRVKMMSLLTQEQKQKLSERSMMEMRGPIMRADDEMDAGPMPGRRGGTPPAPPTGR
ncbi:MAG: periplasmic heavy metal sensor [Nitrospinae bacterium]|nr:periplasmic heavy metal sensor [Nitrospinota bacterium]MBF0633917.1 periplasmic heavy metal sensor [Nitrospinota bacterium]